MYLCFLASFVIYIFKSLLSSASFYSYGMSSTPNASSSGASAFLRTKFSFPSRIWSITSFNTSSSSTKPDCVLRTLLMHTSSSSSSDIFSKKFYSISSVMFLVSSKSSSSSSCISSSGSSDSSSELPSFLFSFSSSTLYDAITSIILTLFRMLTPLCCNALKIVLWRSIGNASDLFSAFYTVDLDSMWSDFLISFILPRIAGTLQLSCGLNLQYPGGCIKYSISAFCFSSSMSTSAFGS